MIIFVHSLYFVLKYALRWYRRQQEQHILQNQLAAVIVASSTTVVHPPAVPLDPEECFVFPIPVYRQRYATVQDVLLDPRWRKSIKKVVDFGCAEFGFFQYLKHLLGVTNVLEVDIDESLLKENMFKVQPLTADFLKQRPDPLTVEVLRGSIADPDWRIKDIDAVIGIEIIEHLYPDVLDAFPYNIFGYAQPKLAVFTTPNADFNVLFPNFKGFRHDDHKFEWTREQFEDWANNIVTRFPNYSVSFAGIGKGPKGTESLGCCSQMAIFCKEYDIVESEVPENTDSKPPALEIEGRKSFGVCTHYSFSQAQIELLSDELLNVDSISTPRDSARSTSNDFYYTVGEIKYPYYEDKRTPEEKLLYEATQQIFRYSKPSSRFFNEDTGAVEIPLYEVVRNFEGTFATEAEIQKILEAADFKIAECTLFGTDERCLCVLYDVDMAGHSSKTASDYYEPSEHPSEEAEHDDDPWNSLSPTPVDPLHLVQRNVNSSNDSDWEVDTDVRGVKAGQVKDEVATPSDPLVDSGYQKSLSNAEWSPQSPIDGHFDEQFMPKMDVNDIKDSIKARMAQSRNGKVMNNRLLSEWRRFSGGSGSSSSGAKGTPTTAPPSLGGTSKIKSPTAGTSRRKKFSSHAGSRRSDSEDSVEDVKSIAEVIMYNSLNKLNILDIPHVEQVVLPVERPQNLELPQFIVENGDVANNNLDGEGNNYPEVEHVVQMMHNLIQDGVQLQGVHEDPNENINQDQDHNEDQENRNVQNHQFVNVNHDEGVVADELPRQPEPVHVQDEEENVVQVLEIIDVHEAERPPLPEEDEDEVNHASREALFDPNSTLDMLEDGSITDETADFDAETDTTDADADPPPETSEEEETVTPVNNLFPNWLLQLLGGANYVAAGDDDDVHVDDEDEAHFYCQGDGLGVHPSIVEVDADTSSNSSSTDVAQAEQTISENDAGSLPTDGVATVSTPSDTAATTAALAIFGRALDLPLVTLEQSSSNLSQDSAGDEFFDTVADPGAASAPLSPQIQDTSTDSDATTPRPDPTPRNNEQKF